jgi:D-sedoheptulose 7-phosphate isomerase
VEALGQAGDALVGISTSGESTNVIRALETARTREMLTVGLLGKGGGAALELVDEAILIPSHSTARIQEAHILIGHIFCEIVELELNLA